MAQRVKARQRSLKPLSRPVGEPEPVLSRLLTPREVGELLGCKPRNVVEFIRKRGLRAVHLGRHLGWRIDPADLATWIERAKGAA